MQRTLLFSFVSDWIKITVEAYFDGIENLIVEGYDIGERVKEVWGDSDYEYSITISPTEVNKLYAILGLAPGDKKGLLDYLQANFNTNTCYSEIRNFLDKHQIKHEGFSWT